MMKNLLLALLSYWFIAPALAQGAINYKGFSIPLEVIYDPSTSGYNKESRFLTLSFVFKNDSEFKIKSSWYNCSIFTNDGKNVGEISALASNISPNAEKTFSSSTTLTPSADLPKRENIKCMIKSVEIDVK